MPPPSWGQSGWSRSARTADCSAGACVLGRRSGADVVRRLRPRPWYATQARSGSSDQGTTAGLDVQIPTLWKKQPYSGGMARCSFLTNHARALIFIAQDPDVRLRDLAGALDITERSAYSIVMDLSDDGYIVKEKQGRRNRYHIEPDMPLPETVGRRRTIGEVLKLLSDASVLTDASTCVCETGLHSALAVGPDASEPIS